MQILILKIATGVLMIIGISLFTAAIFLVRKIVSALNSKAKFPINDPIDVKMREILQKIEEDYVLIPRNEARALARAITQANSAGYGITNRIDKADIQTAFSNNNRLEYNELISSNLASKNSQKELQNA